MQRLKDVDKSPSRFPIGFWATGLNIDTISEDMTNDWKEAGFTLVHGPRFGHTPERAEKMKQVLDWAHERDIEVIIADSRTSSPKPLKDSTRIQQVSEDYRRAVQTVHAEYGSHPAAFGYFINDEPEPTNLRATCECSKIVRDIASDKQPFINHYPWWPTLHKRYNYRTFEEFIDDFFRMSSVRFLSYDCYAQTIPSGEPGRDNGMGMFFNSLCQYGAAARQHGADLWNIVLSTPHYEYIVPSEDVIRWQFNCTVAHGGKGVFYYTFYTPGASIHNFRNGPINEFGERTEVFSWLKRTNRRFLETYGDLFLELELKKASHAGRIYGSVPEFEPDDLILAVEARNERGEGVIKGHPLVVSRFSCPTGGQYVMVVNNSLERSVVSRVMLRGADRPVWSYEWPSGERPVSEFDDPPVIKEKDHQEISTWLAPGQEILYRIGVKLDR